MREPARDLVAVIQDLSFARDLDSVMAIVRRAARAMASADGATFVLRDGAQCYYADEDAIAPLWKGRRFPMAACISGWVMQHRERVMIPDIYVDPRVPADAYRPTFVRSLAMVPVRASDPIGAIGVYWARLRSATEEELALLQALADATALAVANAELYQGLRQAAARAQAASQAKDEFLMLLSHELRTPLMPLFGWARILEANPHDSQAVAQAAAAIARNARFELALVDQLLDVSAMLAGSLEIERAELDLVAALDDALQAIEAEAQAKELRVERDVRASELRVNGDAGRLRQAFGHLLSNAVKYTPPGGRIGVRVSQEGGAVRVEVSDTGIGIAPQSLEGIFQRFGRIDNSMRREHPGLGLGLALTRHIVELHGGCVEASSAGSERGATFVVRLPRAPAAAATNRCGHALRDAIN